MSDGISKAAQLIDQAMSGNVPVYHSGNETTSPAASSSGKSGGIGHKIYTQLMNGVSHMLPFVVGGGILIAIAFLIDGLSIDLSSLPADERAAFGTITPAAALFKQIGGVAFGFMLPVLAGYIAMAIGDRPGACSWICRRNDRGRRKIRIFRSACSRICSRIYYFRSEESVQ